MFKLCLYFLLPVQKSPSGLGLPAFSLAAFDSLSEGSPLQDRDILMQYRAVKMADASLSRLIWTSQVWDIRPFIYPSIQKPQSWNSTKMNALNSTPKRCQNRFFLPSYVWTSRCWRICVLGGSISLQQRGYRPCLVQALERRGVVARQLDNSIGQIQ